MKRPVSSSVLALCLLLFGALQTVVAQTGTGHFRQGLEWEKAQQWEKAANEFFQALEEDSANIKYVAGYRRNAISFAQQLFDEARELLRHKDYAKAHAILHRAYAFDARLRWALNLVCGWQNGRVQDDGRDILAIHAEQERTACTGYWRSFSFRDILWRDCADAYPEPLQKFYLYYANLEDTIRRLAESLGVKVIFDAQSFSEPRFLTLSLRNVTTFQAIDYISLQEGLFFVQVGKNMVWVANQARRQVLEEKKLQVNDKSGRSSNSPSLKSASKGS